MGEHETLTSMCLFTRPHRPTGRMNTEPSLKPAKRNNHNVSLEEKTWSISCRSPLCLSQLNFNLMCYFCDESHAFRSAPEYIDPQCDVQSVSCMMSHSRISCDDWLNAKAALLLFLLFLLISFLFFFSWILPHTSALPKTQDNWNQLFSFSSSSLTTIITITCSWG